MYAVRRRGRYSITMTVFLALLDNEEYRDELSNLLPDQVDTSRIWGQVRDPGKGFQSGLTSLFYGEDKKLNALIVEYGVF